MFHTVSVAALGEVRGEMDVPYVISESPWSLTDHGRKAEIKLKSNVYDLEAWSVLIREAQVTQITAF